MKEIKFRAWDKRTHLYKNLKQHFFYFTLLDLSERRTTIDNDHIIMQYTGLHDKNGKEIYEGDILNYRDVFAPSSLSDEGEEVVRDMVEWLQDVGYSENEMGRDYSRCSEVIGNIYEN